MAALPSPQSLVCEAFAAVPYPGDDHLRGSSEGVEPYRTEAEFLGKRDWTLLTAEFIDQAPAGLGSALSFLSDAAFRFYIPAYILADLDGKLQRANPLFHLTYGLESASRNEPVNPQRYGALTWFDYAQQRFRGFDQAQRRAVAEYLNFKKLSGEQLEEDVAAIEEALACFWRRDAA